MTVQLAYFRWGKRCTISLFCRPSGTSAAQLSPQRATGHQCRGEEAEERAWMCSRVKSFCQRSGQLLCAYGLFRVKVKRRHHNGAHTLRDPNPACTLCTVHVVIFDHLSGLLRGQHNPVSSVDAAYHSHSQRLRCEDIPSPQRCPGWGFPLPARRARGLPEHVALYLCLLHLPEVPFVLYRYCLC